MSDQIIIDGEIQDQKKNTEQNCEALDVDDSSIMIELNCKACQKRFTDPRILPCLHSFCAECIRSFEPFIISSDDRNPSLSASMSSLSSIVNTVVTVMCPTCETEVDLPKRGVYELPVNFMIRRGLLQEALNPNSKNLPCDLCEDEADAITRCIDCTVNLCNFCSQAHNRQRKTSSHKVMSLNDVKKECVDGLWSPLKCQSHEREEQRLFCETCDKTICRDCCIVEHRDHAIKFNDEIVDENRTLLVKLISKTEPHISSLQSTLDKIDDLNRDIDNNKEVVIQEINKFIASYVSALQKHKQQLIEKVDKVCEGKKQALKAQELHVKQTLQDIQHSCTFAKKAVAEGNNDEFLSVKPVLARRMVDISRIQVHAGPRSDAFLKFLPELPAGEVDSFELFGDIESKLIDPLKCSATGDGLYIAREEEEAEFCVVVCDNEGNKCPQGAEDINIEIVPRGRRNGQHVTVDIEDEDDGSHKVYYTPEEAGQYFISVFINSQHIKGSPFMVNVRCAWREHTGIFHCCTFCSSEGRKDVSCACGGTMPGGFKGCGHGHEGHPGKAHWSCCGKFDESSECARVFNEPSKLKTVSV
ncbi:tripartite motif-containing protein 45-like [Anneissia japonica]|uniref:tripartite motif-containing protein 45-like n=1 Tax=Anneissia japonica TaxID=1529436 RepID=UPI001425AA62|nr:tripartite motif-containing protein 45-like [Anneissia japonica]